MGDGTTVSTTPMEWRSRVRAIAQARPVVFFERDVGQRLLLMRKSILDGFSVTRRKIKVKVELNYRGSS
jgi:hypothetical protein